MAVSGPIARDQAFHVFADTSLLGIRHFGIVASNFEFLAAGVAGLRHMVVVSASCSAATALMLRTWFSGLILVAAGSAWYHAAPSDASLIWDRAAMMVVFAAASGPYVADRIAARTGALLFCAIAALGIWSQVHWNATGDLRAYRFAEHLPFVLVPAVCVLFPGRLTTFRHAAAVIALFATATACEFFDTQIDALLGHVLSGQTIKHLHSAAAGWLIAPMIAGRARAE